jgi:LTXXQ motif family protein
MRKTLCAGAVALAMAGLLPSMPVLADEFATEQGLHASINIERIRAALKLTPEQAKHWAPVEAALRDLVRHQPHVQSDDGYVQRVSRRAVSIVLTSAAVQRLAAAARPLIASLTDAQKESARSLAEEMGLGPVVAAMN